jgi:salicylate hydroxylase
LRKSGAFSSRGCTGSVATNGTILGMHRTVLIAGGGIGGLASALACARGGAVVSLFERRRAFEEFGAGIQLGPNAVRVLHEWGLRRVLEAVAHEPPRLVVRDAAGGRQLGVLPLAARARERYGAPYLTIARADLLQLLLEAVQRQDQVALHLAQPVESYEEGRDSVELRFADGRCAHGALLLGADGLWSRIRAHMLGDGPPRSSGHVAYRAMLPQTALPAHLRRTGITVWLGPRLHVVEYPVHRGEWLNVVLVVEGSVAGDPQAWGEAVERGALLPVVGSISLPLRDLIEHITEWRSWSLFGRPPVAAAAQMARGRIALVGDAAHPTRPYLAQGAGMAIEDAHVLGEVLRLRSGSVEERLERYAALRWRRCARIQMQSARNGVIFHARGPMRWGRDASLRLLGERLLDQPWLYGYRAGIETEDDS